MKKILKLSSEYFCGNKASDYAIQNGYLDYATLAKAFDAVLNNEIIKHGYWEKENGFIDYSDEIEELEEQIIDIKESQENLSDETQEKIEELQNKIDELKEEEDSANNTDVSQWYIISEAGASILRDYTNELVYYNEELDMHLWGVTHYGTSWDYVLTDIKLNCKK